MAFGKAPCIPAHEGNNPILPRRDRAAQAERGRNPAVPRAPRAKARANSCGLLARELKKDSANSSVNSLNSGVSRSSESRRPAADSPFAQMGHARVNMLTRERHDPINQVFEMGPKERATSCDRRESHERGHWLGKESEINAGMPWAKPKEQDESQVPKARRHVLQNERKAADQEYRQAIKESRPPVDESDVRSGYARVNRHVRELRDAAQAIEFAPMVQVNGFTSAAEAAVGEKFHGRRNVLARQTAEESIEAPIASGLADYGVPTYARKSMLPPCAPRDNGQMAAAH